MVDASQVSHGNDHTDWKRCEVEFLYLLANPFLVSLFMSQFLLDSRPRDVQLHPLEWLVTFHKRCCLRSCEQ